MNNHKTIAGEWHKIRSVCCFDSVKSFDNRPQIRGPGTPLTPAAFWEGPLLTPGAGYSRFDTSEGPLTPSIGGSPFDNSSRRPTPGTGGSRFDTSEGPLTPGTGRSRFNSSLRPPTPGIGRSNLDDSEGSATITPGTNLRMKACKGQTFNIFIFGDFFHKL